MHNFSLPSLALATVSVGAPLVAGFAPVDLPGIDPALAVWAKIVLAALGPVALYVAGIMGRGFAAWLRAYAKAKNDAADKLASDGDPKNDGPIPALRAQAAGLQAAADVIDKVDAMKKDGKP